MKKIFAALFVVAVLAVSVPGYGFDLKKKSCEAACDKTYKKCMKQAKEEFEKSKDSVKQTASELACSEAKDKCYKECGKK